jgi:aspartate/methionine/tyrosine aminotransferase
MRASSLSIPPSPRDWLSQIRPAVRDIETSGIVEVFDYGRDRQGLIPLWVGEGDLPTPAFIADAAKASLDRGETFYTHQGGMPALRASIASYMTRVYGAAPGGGEFSSRQFFVTIGGMHALDIAVRMIVGPGEEALIPSPAWPNFAGALAANGARPCFVTLERGEAWRLDPERLAAAVTPATRAIFFNSPANPTGFIATQAELIAALDLARRHDLWIVADEIYGRLTYDGRRAPSFHDIMAPDDKILFVQTFSKNWAMTGWRIGWLEAPPALAPAIENLVQYSTSGVPVFAQRAAVAALEEGEAFLADLTRRMRASRDILSKSLAETGRVRFSQPEGAFYLFCSVLGEPDSRRLALRLIDEAGVGAAPGNAFGPGGEGYLRLCFARAPEEIAEASRRLVDWLRR